MAATVYLVLVLVCGILWYFGRSVVRFIYLARKLPGPSILETLTVHATELLGDNAIMYASEISAAYGYKPWSILMTNVFSVIVSDSEGASEMYKSKNLLERPDFFYKPMLGFLGKSLLTRQTDSLYKQHRKILSPAFRKGFLDAHVPIINEETAKLRAFLRLQADGKSFDVRSLIDESLVSVALRMISGHAAEPSEAHFFASGYLTGVILCQMESINPLNFWLLSLLSSSIRKKREFAKEASEELKRIFLEGKRRALSRVNEESFPSNLIEVMVQRNVESGEEYFSDENFVAECRTVLAGSAETSAFAVNVCMLLLALHPEVQDRVHEEMDSIFGQSDGVVEPEDLSKMVYLGMVLKEVIRLYPPIPLLGRKADKEIVLDDLTLPKGCAVALNIMALHRNPKDFEDPEKFEPDRFSPERSDGRHPYAYLPFSSGLRQCPGQLQGYQLMKLYLSMIVRNFRLLPGDNLKTMEDIKTKMYITMHLMQSSLRLVKRDGQ